MKYALRIVALGKLPEVEISEEEYEKFKNAKVVLSNALAIEERYEYVVTNYLDFEKQVLDVTAEHMVRSHIEYTDFFDVRLALNIRLVNLLTAARMYLDQLVHNIATCVPDGNSAVKEIREYCSSEYDAHKAYRFMEALRNHVQHRGIPVHWTSQGGRWTSLKDGYMESYTMIASMKQMLQEDGEFKTSVLDENDDKIDLVEATRRYVESLSVIHCAARKRIEHSVTNARKIIEQARTRYAEVHNSLAGLSACRIDGGQIVESVQLLLDWDDIRIKLAGRNQKLSNLHRSYVVSRTMAHNKALVRPRGGTD